MKCKAIQCNRAATEGQDFCPTCTITGPYGGFFSTDPIPTLPKGNHPVLGSFDNQRKFAQQQASLPIIEKTLAEQYPKYYKPVGDRQEIDVYTVHYLFDIQDPSGCIQHASKKLLLSGVRTGGKSAHDDIREARDTLNRWLQLNPSPKQPTSMKPNYENQNQ